MTKIHHSAFIVGGSSGIGLAIAKQLVSLGTQVCIFARNKHTLDVAQKEILSIVPDKKSCTAFEVDAANYDDLKLCFDKAITMQGIPDLLINCAGGAIPDYFLNISAAQMQRTFHANFQTAWNACHIMIPHLKISGATILNTSSVGGLIGVFGYTDYSAAKFAIIGFSEALRQEMMKYNIRVQVLCPPDTDTPGFENENKTKPIETKMISASAKLLTSEMVADECIRKLSSKQFLIIPGFDGKLSWWLKRHFPTFVDWAIKKSIKV